MRLLSVKLTMSETFSRADFESLLSQWTKGAEEGTQTQENAGCAYFKREQTEEGQTWTTQAIFQDGGEKKLVFIHIDSDKDRVLPLKRTEIIRVFVNSGKIKSGALPVSEEAFTVADENKEYIAKLIREGIEGELPLVLASIYFDANGAEIDENTVAKELAGLAYVVTVDSEYTRLLKEKAKKRIPFNGSVAIYQNGKTVQEYRKTDKYSTESIDRQIIKEIRQLTTATLADSAPSWEKVEQDKLAADKEALEELLKFTFDKNKTLEDKCKEAVEKIKTLYEENKNLRGQNEQLLRLTEKGEKRGMINKALIAELYSDEQYDAVIIALEKRLESIPKNTRCADVLKKIIAENPLRGEGRKFFEEVKKIFADGEGLTPKKERALKALGFEMVGDNNHYKIKHVACERPFNVAKTSSDSRSGKNLASDIERLLSIY